MLTCHILWCNVTAMFDPNVAMDPQQARRALNKVISKGEVIIPTYAQRALAEDGMTDPDLWAVLKQGWIQFPEWECNQWRYRIALDRDWVVLAFKGELNAVVITAWRKK